MNILITGGCGFIGSHLTEYHLNVGDHVFVVDDLSTGSLKNIEAFQHHASFEWEKADILEWQRLPDIVKRVDRIYHLAAVLGVKKVIAEPISVLKTNIFGCERVLRVCSKENKKAQIMIASSSSVYGHREKSSLTERDYLGIGEPWQQPSGYAMSKLADEGFGVAYAQKFNMPIVIMRLFNTVGLRQTGLYGMVIPRFVHQACTGQAITVYGDGKQTRSFCDVRDTIVAITTLMDHVDQPGDVINVGSQHEVSIQALADLVKERAQSHSTIQHIAFNDVYGKNYYDVTQRRPDVTKLYRYTQFEAQIPLQTTIDDLISHHKREV